MNQTLKIATTTILYTILYYTIVYYFTILYYYTLQHYNTVVYYSTIMYKWQRSTKTTTANMTDDTLQ